MQEIIKETPKKEVSKQVDAVYINTDASIKVNQDTVWKPLWTYFYYLFCRVFKMISTYVIIILGLGACLLVTVLPTFFADEVQTSVIPMVMTLLSLFVIVFAGTLGISKSLNIFTDFETDGSELLVISKQISRTQIIIAKFSFLLLVGILFSVAMAGVIAIGITIVGWDKFESVNAATVIAGSFGGSLISFAFMGMMSIAIGLKISGKLARALPSGILSISAVIAMIGVSLFSILAPNPPAGFYSKLETEINTELKAQTINYTETAGDGTEITSRVRSIKLSDSSFASSFEYLYTSEKTNVFFFTAYAFFLDSGIKEFTYKDANEPGYKALQTFMVTQAAAFLNANPINPTGAVAVNFINPISAFATISSASVSAAFSSNTNMMPYNYSFSNYVINPDVVSYGKLSPEASMKIELPYTILAKDAFQWDQDWIVGAAWAGIFVALSIFTIAVYFRKDFK